MRIGSSRSTPIRLKLDLFSKVMTPKLPQIRHVRGLRVLLVEDNLVNQIIVRELLEGQGASVQIAENGQLAVDILTTQADHFDVVLMDLQMPVMDGLQASRHIRSELKLTKLPIIAMTANVLPNSKQDCMDAGMNDFISKPFVSKDLLAKLLLHTSLD